MLSAEEVLQKSGAGSLREVRESRERPPRPVPFPCPPAEPAPRRAGSPIGGPSLRALGGLRGKGDGGIASSVSASTRTPRAPLTPFSLPLSPRPPSARTPRAPLTPFSLPLTPPAPLQVRSLNLWGLGISDLSVLSRCPSLEVLSMAQNAVADLAPLAQGCPRLREIYLRRNSLGPGLEPLFPLARLPGLRIVWLEENECSRHPLYRPFLLRLLPSLEKLDSHGVGEGDRKAAHATDDPALEELLKRAARWGAAGAAGAAAGEAAAASAAPAPLPQGGGASAHPQQQQHYHGGGGNGGGNGGHQHLPYTGGKGGPVRVTHENMLGPQAPSPPTPFLPAPSSSSSSSAAARGAGVVGVAAAASFPSPGGAAPLSLSGSGGAGAPLGGERAGGYSGLSSSSPPPPPQQQQQGSLSSSSTAGASNNVLTAVLVLLRDLEDGGLDKVAAACREMKAQREARAAAAAAAAAAGGVRGV
jgi:hypothetical protein